MDLIIELIQNEAILKAIIGLVVAAAGALHVSEKTQRIIARVLEDAPRIVRAVRQVMDGVDDVTGEHADTGETHTDNINRAARNRAMRNSADAQLLQSVPLLARATAAVTRYPLRDRIGTAVEASVNDLKRVDSMIAAKNVDTEL